MCSSVPLRNGQGHSRGSTEGSSPAAACAASLAVIQVQYRLPLSADPEFGCKIRVGLGHRCLR